MKNAKTILSAIMAVVILSILFKSLIEIIDRSMKPDERYTCRLQRLDENGLPYDSFVASMRLEWPLEISQLWVGHSGRGIIGSHTFDFVAEGEGLRDHTVYARQSHGDVSLSFDRLTGVVTYGPTGGPWVEGVCRIASSVPARLGQAYLISERVS